MFTNNEEIKATVGAQFHCAKVAGGSATTSSRSLAAFLLGCMALLAAPNAALADDECGPQAGPALIECAAGDYSPDGISYTSNGDLNLELAPITAPGDSLGAGLSVAAGNLDDNLTVTTTGEIGSIQIPNHHTASTVIDLASEAGTIDLILGGAVRSVDITEYLIRARSTQGGDINIDGQDGFLSSSSDNTINAVLLTTNGGNIDFATTSNVIRNLSGGSDAALRAEAGGGDITLNLGRVSSGDGGDGVVAVTSGSGRVSITTGLASQGGVNALFSSGSGILATAGTGGIQLEVNGSIGFDFDGDGGVGIVTQSPGLTEIDILDGITGRENHAGELRTIQASGADATLRLADEGRMGGNVDFSGITGSVEIQVDSWWDATGVVLQNEFGDADTTLRVGPDGELRTGTALSNPDDLLDPETHFNFGSGSSSVVNEGLIVVGFGGGTQDAPFKESRTVFNGLDSFENSGLILLGARSTSSTSDVLTESNSDGHIDDVLAMHGAAFTGSGNGRIVIDADLGATTPQTNCNDRRGNGDLAAADCVDLTDGTTAGRTGIVIREKFSGDRGAYSPEGHVLVDVAGGDSGVGHFYVHPKSDSYSGQFGGVVEKGLFFYPMGYDDQTQQHKLYGLPSQGAQQLPLLQHAAQSLWRTAAGTWFERQGSLRAAARENLESGGGAWGRVAHSSGERDVAQSVQAGAQTFVFDNGYQQDGTALTFGVDWLRGQVAGGTWSFGLMAGYGKSRVDFDQSVNTHKADALYFGGYTSFVRGGWFIDAVLNQQWLQTDVAIPALQLNPEETVLEADGDALGMRVESGWLFDLGRFSLEPLVSFTSVSSSLESLDVPSDDASRFGGRVQFDDARSTRAGLGLRFNVENVLPNVAPTDLNLTVRAIDEMDGESDASIDNVGPLAAPVSSDFDGTFTEVSGGVSITNARKTVGGFLNVDAAFGDDYDSLGFTTGVRVQW